MKRVTTEDLREDLDGVEDDTIVDTPIADMPDEQLPAVAVDVTADLEGQYKEIDDIDTGMNDAVDAQSQIAELKQAVEENGEDGKSLSAAEEMAINVAMESIHASLGLKWETPTMESVPYRKRRETVVATLEASIGNIADKIIEGFKKAMRALMDFLTNLLRNNWVLKKYVAFVRSRVTELKGDAPTKETMPESAGAMTVNGKADMSSVDELYDTAMGSLKVTDAAIDEVNKLDFKYTETNSGKVSGDFDPGSFLPRRKNVDSSNRYAGYLVNGRAYQLTNFMAKVMGTDKMYADIKKIDESAQEAEVLSKQNMLLVLKKADEIVDQIKYAERNRNKIKNIISHVTQFAVAVGGIYGGVVSKTARETTSNIERIMGVRKLLNSIVSRMPLEAYKTAKALTDYVRHSLKYYKSAEA